MAKLVFYGFHLGRLAGVTTTVPGGALNPERLTDRRIVFPYVDSSNAGTRRIKLNQAALAKQVSAAGFVAGHNLAGATVELKSSPDDITYTPRASAVPASSAGFALKVGSLLTAQYWAVDVTGAAAAPSIPELLVTRAVTMPREVSEPGTRQGRVGNVKIHSASSGLDWGAQRGPDRWQASYLVRDVTQADRTFLEELFTDTGGGASPLLLEDADGAFRWVRIVRPEITFAAVPVYSDDFQIDLIEQVG